MLEITTHRNLIRSALIKIIVACAIGTVALFVVWVVDQINLANNGESDFTTLQQSGMKDRLFVTGNIDTAIGPYANETTDGDNGTKSDTSSDAYYYLVPVFSQKTGAIDYFVSFKADSQSDKDEMGKIAQNTADGIDSEPLKIEHGRMVNLADDQKSILKDWVTSDDFYDGGSFVDYCVENNIMGTTDKNIIMSKIVTYSIYRTDYAAMSYINILYMGIPFLIFLTTFLVIRGREKASLKQSAERRKFDINQPM